MHRRDVLLQLSATGFLAGLPIVPPNGALTVKPDGAARAWGIAPFIFLTDQSHPPPAATFVVRIPANTFLSPSWHVGLRIRSIRAALGAGNAVLLMESLRDLRAAVHLVHREGEVELIGATLPAERRTLHARI